MCSILQCRSKVARQGAALLSVTLISLLFATGTGWTQNPGTKGADTGGKILIPDFELRLKKKNAKSGELQISLGWNNWNDLDLHVVCPSGQEIFYGRRRSRCNGVLDVDMNIRAIGDGIPRIER